MSYELTGKVKLIQAEQTFASGFSKREMVVTVEDGNYPQDINIEFVKDKASLLENLKPGQQVTVTFDIKGREYNGRYFNNLQGWKVRSETGDPQEVEGLPGGEKMASTAEDDFDDDIPF